MLVEFITDGQAAGFGRFFRTTRTYRRPTRWPTRLVHCDGPGGPLVNTYDLPKASCPVEAAKARTFLAARVIDLARWHFVLDVLDRVLEAERNGTVTVYVQTADRQEARCPGCRTLAVRPEEWVCSRSRDLSCGGAPGTGGMGEAALVLPTSRNVLHRIPTLSNSHAAANRRRT